MSCVTCGKEEVPFVGHECVKPFCGLSDSSLLLCKFHRVLMHILTEASDHPDDSLRDIINEATWFTKLPFEVNEDWEVIRK